MITIKGNPPKIERVVTNLYTFDRAFENQRGEIGFPLGKIVEIFGPTHVGKSTIAYSLAGILSKDQPMALADFEGFDPDFLVDVLENSGFNGEVNYISGREDEETLDELISLLRKNYKIGIIDSVGAISPISEQQGELGDSNMGRRGLLLAQFSRKAIKILRENPTKSIILINHQYQRIGGLGVTSPGGEVKNYIASARIQVKRKRWKNKFEEFPDGSYIIEGNIIKNRWGYKDRKFNLFILGGKGISIPLTAFYDCLALNLIERGRTIKVGDKNFGTLKTIINEARTGNIEFFQPFFDLLNNNSMYISDQDDEKEISEDD